MDIGKQIKKHRNEMNLSQEELADQIFVSRQTISNWENEKNYPDVKSLVLLSSLFGVSLDTLIKGDLEEMKERIKEEDREQFKRDSNIFSILLIGIIILPVPLAKFGGYVGMGIWALIAMIGIYYAVRVEKHKKRFDIQTYKEILAFSEGKSLNDLEKNYEFGKRAYQKAFLAIGAALLTLVFAFIMILLFNLL